MTEPLFIDKTFSTTVHTAAIAALETTINGALQYDLSTRQRLAAFDDHIFLLHCTSPELMLYIIPGEEVRLCGFYDGEADTILKGSASEFAKLATAKDPASALINGDVELHGDSNALIELQRIAQDLDVDWEAPIVELFGDVVGHNLSQGIRKGLSFGLQAAKSFKRQLDDYLMEESDLFPPRWQVEKFFNNVEQTALQTERLEARINKWRQQQNK